MFSEAGKGEEMSKIAIMLPLFSRYGGVEQFGYRLAEALAASGHGVDFLCARQEAEAPEGVRVLTTGRPAGPRALKMAAFAFGVEKLRERGHYDCAISLGKTLHQDIMRVGGGPLPQFWRHSENAYPEGLSRLAKRVSRRLNPASTLTRWLEHRQYTSGCTIVAVSHFVRDLILASEPTLGPEDVKIVYNLPDCSRFSPATPQEQDEARKGFGLPRRAFSPDGQAQAENPVVIGLATSNFALKGVGPLIRALMATDRRVCLAVAGGRDASSYTRLAQSLGLGNRVFFAGRVSDMPFFYRALDAFILPSFYDACSNAVLEALASGLPVASSRCNGSSFFLPPENIIENPADEAELARMMNRLAAQPAGSGPECADRLALPEGVHAGLPAFVRIVEEFLRSPPA
jgi:Glycosyltransferase